MADIFDEGIESEVVIKRTTKIKFGKEKGIASHVARTGEQLNIADVYSDSRFNREVDQKMGFITKSVLCMPVMSVEEVQGTISNIYLD